MNPQPNPFSILNIITIMKTKIGLKRKKNIHKEQKNQTGTQIQLCLEWILGLINCLALHDHHQRRNHEFFLRKWWNRSEKMKKSEEQLREEERKKKVCTTSFVPNDVLSEALSVVQSLTN